MRFLLTLVFSIITCSTCFAQQNAEVIIVPVVVHVLYSNAHQNISNAQIFSQLEVLNNDFGAENEDRKMIPAYFKSLSADCGIRFRLAAVDPYGAKTNGIVRKKSAVWLFGSDDKVKFSSSGGDDAWDKNKYLNIWVCNLAGIVGYTSQLGGPAGNDGVVIRFSAFGNTGSVVQPFHLGRTATHEIGHWLNLRHIWGDEYCGDDEVDDTPKQRSANKGTPSGVKYSCDLNEFGDMYMNFMDLTDDAGMYMFTKGQRQRMRDVFKWGGPRHDLLESGAFDEVADGNAQAVLPPQPTEELIVFPNPANDIITVQSNDWLNRSLVIFNQSGQPVITQKLTAKLTQIRVAHLKAGSYYIKREKDPFRSVTRFIKL
ncbi:MAG: M43 family zinc metalloprotease [Chitinophagaceae bacterium]